MLRGLALAVALLAGGWQTAPAPKVDVTGAWTVTFTIAEGQRSGLAILSQDGTTVTGMIGPAETDMMPADGTVSGDKLTLTLRPRAGRTAAFAKIEATVEGDRMTGTIDAGKGTIELVKRKRS
jgi:hypothetical protein